MSDEERITFRATTRLADALDAWVAKTNDDLADFAPTVTRSHAIRHLLGQALEAGEPEALTRQAKRGHAADKAAEIAADDWQQWGRTRDDARREKLKEIRRLLDEG